MAAAVRAVRTFAPTVRSTAQTARAICVLTAVSVSTVWETTAGARTVVPAETAWTCATAEKDAPIAPLSAMDVMKSAQTVRNTIYAVAAICVRTV